VQSDLAWALSNAPDYTPPAAAQADPAAAGKAKRTGARAKAGPEPK
jgi:hypothetical protein